jgi:hypothetical protein
MAFLDWLQGPALAAAVSRCWNGLDNTPLVMPDAVTLAEWTACVQAARARLLMQDNLVAQLWALCAKNGKIQGFAQTRRGTPVPRLCAFSPRNMHRHGAPSSLQAPASALSGPNPSNLL